MSENDAQRDANQSNQSNQSMGGSQEVISRARISTSRKLASLR